MGMNTLMASEVRAATNNSGDLVRQSGQKGAHFIINMTAVPGVDTVTFTVQGKDNLGNYYTILASAALVATGVVTLRVYPGCIAAANLIANDVLPDVYRVLATHSGSGNFTYTVCENSLF